VLRICLRKSRRADSRSAESLLKANTNLFNREHRPVAYFFRALKQRLSNLVNVLFDEEGDPMPGRKRRGYQERQW